MNKPKNYISKEAATQTIARLFDGEDKPNMLTLEELYRAAGRESYDEATNRNWFNNKYSQLKYHGLVRTVSEFDKDSRRHKTTGLQLTMAGQDALGRTGGELTASTVGEEPKGVAGIGTVNDLATAVRDFQAAHPEFDIVLDIKFRGLTQV